MSAAITSPTDVYPSHLRGQQVMDAGIIMFANGSKLELQKSMGFKNQNIYCVAPIVMGGNTTMGTYDFWAVGKDCCSGSTADFHCTGFNEPNSQGQGRIRLVARNCCSYVYKHYNFVFYRL